MSVTFYLVDKLPLETLIEGIQDTKLEVVYGPTAVGNITIVARDIFKGIEKFKDDEPVDDRCYVRVDKGGNVTGFDVNGASFGTPIAYMEDKLSLRIVCEYDRYDEYEAGERQYSLEEVWERLNSDVLVKPQPLKFVKKKEQV